MFTNQTNTYNWQLKWNCQNSFHPVDHTTQSGTKLYIWPCSFWPCLSAFWSWATHELLVVLTFELLEDRPMDDVTIDTICFLWCKTNRFHVSAGTAQYSTVQYNTAQYSTVQHSTVTDQRKPKNVLHLVAPRVPVFCFNYILTSPVIYLWTDAWSHGIYLLSLKFGKKICLNHRVNLTTHYSRMHYNSKKTTSNYSVIIYEFGLKI